MGDLRTAAVIASCDQEEFIEASIASVAPQVDHVVVVDDASSDGSVARIRSLDFRNLTLIELPVRVGVSEAFNIAVEAAAEEIILIQGGDDLSLPGRASAHVTALRDPRVAISAALPVIVGSDDGPLPDSAAREFVPPADGVDALAHLFFNGNFLCAPSVAVRHDDYRRWGGFFRNIDLLQDYLMWLQALSEGQLAWWPEPLVSYRKHSHNSSRGEIGLDSPRRRRHSAELEYVLTSFIDRAPDPVVGRLCAAAGISHSPRGGAHSDALRALVMLSHPHQAVQRRGLHRLFDISQGQSGGDVLGEIGVSRLDIDEFAQAVDHENSGSIRRAAASSAASSASHV